MDRVVGVNGKSYPSDRKVGRGVGLRPSLWARIDAYAETQGKNRNQVIEELLNAYIPALRNLPSTHGDYPATQKEVIDLPA